MRLIDADALIERLRKARLIFDKNEARFESLGIGYAIEIIEQETPTISQWIPCSERLPELEKIGWSADILLTDGVNIWVGWCVLGKEWADYGKAVTSDKPIAWMPLPEAYKERSE